MKKDIQPVDLSKIKTKSITKRQHKAKIKDFMSADKLSGDFMTFFEGLPGILKAKDLKEITDAIINARENNKPIIWACGDAVIKVGLSPILIKLMKEGFISAIAMQGAGAIHDTEVALIGETSEDVAVSIKDGSFGMAEETGNFLNEAIIEAAKEDKGMGEVIGRKMVKENLPYKEYSILANAYELDIPVTIHVAVGTDTIHMHPKVSGEALGKASHIDFRKFTSCVKEMSQGGVIINIASAVILPEVFLKALSITRNIYGVGDFTACNFDMIMHYRPTENVVKRPTQSGGRGFNILGHLEIMIPLLAKALLEKSKK
jgi:deoxyhypusine synthase